MKIIAIKSQQMTKQQSEELRIVRIKQSEGEQ